MLQDCGLEPISHDSGDRVIPPVLMKNESQKEKEGTDFKEFWLHECLEWFPSNASKMGKFVMMTIAYTGSSPMFLVFTIYYGDSMEVLS